MPDITFDKSGRSGVVTLDRQHALNAVTHDMVARLSGQLDRWASDDTVERVVIHAAPGKAFSAGGDIRALYEARQNGEDQRPFFALEYATNVQIAEYPKPYIAVVDGIAMGGGVGVSFHGSHVIAGPNARFAMPEVGIGFFPDVGASYLLSRLDHHIGLYLGLTGRPILQGDLVACGLASGATQDAPALVEASKGDEPLASCLAKAETEVSPGEVWENRALIEDAFGQDSVEAILSRLTDLSATSTFAADALDAMGRASPLSLQIAYRQLMAGKTMTLRECMEMEYRIVSHVLEGRDFYEGTRAAVIDKDRAPLWEQAGISEVSEQDLEKHFSPLAEELRL